LLDYLTKSEIHLSSKNYIQTHGQRNDPSGFLEPKEALKIADGKLNLIHYFISILCKKNYEKKIFLLLGDSGMGKTTFLINLYLAYKKVIRLNKRPIFYIPLSDPNYRDRIIQLRNTKPNSILLLDAFDEDVNAWDNPEHSLKGLLELSSMFSTIIITSRGQFFTSKIEDFHRLNKFYSLSKEEIQIDKLYISPVGNKSVMIYLGKKYLPFRLKRFYRAVKIVKSCPNLVVRPMILNNIDYLLKQGKPYTFTVEIYLDLIISWIEREKKFVNTGTILAISKELAKDINNNRKTRGGLFIEESAFPKIVKLISNDIEPNALKARGLLNRIGGKIKFSHKSIFEYFLATAEFDIIDLELIHKHKFENPFYLDGLSDAYRFYNELFIIKVSIPYINIYCNKPVNAETLQKTKVLNLERGKIKTLEFIKELKWLTEINLSSSTVRDLKPLYGLKSLKKIDLRNTYYSQSSLYYESAIEELNALKTEIPNIKILN